MATGSKRDRSRHRPPPSVQRPYPQRVTGPAVDLAPVAPPVPVTPEPLAPEPAPSPRALTGAKKVKKKCCRSQPRCKGCPVVLMRAARLHESGLTGKDLKKAVKRARAA